MLNVREFADLLEVMIERQGVEGFELRLWANVEPFEVPEDDGHTLLIVAEEDGTISDILTPADLASNLIDEGYDPALHGPRTSDEDYE
jgi:hypothetical protein